MKTFTDLIPPDMLQTLPLLGLYAEAHFRFRIPFSRYFKRQPELIFDAPWRLEPGQPLTLFLLIKDADLFPVRLERVAYDFRSGDQDLGSRTFPLDQELKSSMTHLEMEITDLDLPRGELLIFPSLVYLVAGKRYVMKTDNYHGIDKPPLRINVSGEKLPKPQGWLSGDLHLHSNLTNDQIEFGAPLAQTRKAAQLFGLDYFTATDHSYDLDDEPKNYLKNDPSLKKWTDSRGEISKLNDSPGPTLVPGEEISVANKRGATVHFLHFNDDKFFAGNGDSGDDWPKMVSQYSVDDVLEQRSQGTVSVAAHTAYKFPWWQRWLLKRGWWEAQDHLNQALDGVQILCGSPGYEAFHQSRQLWIYALLKGQHLAVYGGSDGHGNFNRNWHIKIPLWSMGIHEDQIFAQVTTLLRSPDTSVGSLMEAMRSKRTALSTGPVGELTLNMAKEVHEIGSHAHIEWTSRSMWEMWRHRKNGYWNILQTLTALIPAAWSSNQNSLAM